MKGEEEEEEKKEKDRRERQGKRTRKSEERRREGRRTLSSMTNDREDELEKERSVETFRFAFFILRNKERRTPPNSQERKNRPRQRDADRSMLPMR